MATDTSAFSKRSSMCLKGFAIILLMCIHCFGDAERFAGYDFTFWPIGEELFIELAYYCKICVSLFAFISGYGLYLSARSKTNSISETNKWLTSRVIKTLSGFWFVYVVSFIILINIPESPIEKYFTQGLVRGCVYVLLDFMGISHLCTTTTINASWWYMSAAIVFILLMPLLIKSVKKIGWLLSFVIIAVVPRVLFNGESFGATGIYTFILPVYFGALFAEYNVFEKINDFKIVKNKAISDIILFFGLIFIILVSIYIWIRVPYTKTWEYHYGLAPIPLIVFCNKYLFNGNNIISRILCVIFAFFGKHSMNIFVFHSFIRVHLLNEYIYSFKIPALTIIVLFAISLGASIIFELVKKLIFYNKLMDYLEKKVVSLIP